ncbi:hypothetical protein [Actinocrispum wychmicini]|uniref:YwqJ-like deaminase n=1 Tax=Actinocrispum wychmicini TaxID=1213861 RepID=A0A4R2JYH1_9PSEU|nr:hypothetical protein [Actinocrispum wychmicini]TCO64924.1 hypothetical protein EV192_101708 [Actinocrispum wychmicini]
MPDVHVIEIAEDGAWQIQHTSACPLHLRDCPVSRAAEQIVGPTAVIGRFECELGPLDQLLIGRPVVLQNDQAAPEQDIAAQRHVAKLALGLAGRLLQLFATGQQGHPGEPCVRTGWVQHGAVARWRELHETLVADYVALDPEHDPTAPGAPTREHGTARGIRFHGAADEPLCDECAAFFDELKRAGLVRETSGGWAMKHGEIEP